MANHSNCLYFCQVAILFVNKMFIQDLSNSLNISYFMLDVFTHCNHHVELE